MASSQLQAAFLDAAMGRVKCQRLSKGYVHQSSMASHAMLPGGDTHSSVASALLHSQIYCHWNFLQFLVWWKAQIVADSYFLL